MGNKLENFLNRNKACKEGKDWCQQGGFTTFAQMWGRCEDPAWMLWGLEHAGHEEGPSRLTRKWAHQCLLLVNAYLSDTRTRRAMKILADYAGGKGTQAEMVDGCAAATAAAKARAAADAYAERCTPQFHATRALACALTCPDNEWTKWANEATTYAAMAAAQYAAAASPAADDAAELIRKSLVENRKQQANILRSVFSADMAPLFENLDHLD